jgi:hypothetical protein
MISTRFLLLALALAITGCATRRTAIAPPPPPPQNYFSGETHGAPIRRVALLPLYHVSYPDHYLRSLDEIFESELTKKALFEVVPVTRSNLEALFGRRQFESTEKLPADALERLRQQHGVQGVMFTDLTHLSPYRPIAMGVRTKLVDASTGKIRWAFDYVFDAGNGSVAEAAKRYQLLYSDERQPLTTDGGSILLSPSRFAKYVASETYASLTHDNEPEESTVASAARDFFPKVRDEPRR